MANLKTGDVVRLKSGGPDMTVSAVGVGIVGEEERVVGGRVQLAMDNGRDVSDGVARGAVYLRHAAKRVRPMDSTSTSLAPETQPVRPPCTLPIMHEL